MSVFRVLVLSLSRVEDDEEVQHWCAGSFVAGALALN